MGGSPFRGRCPRLRYPRPCRAHHQGVTQGCITRALAGRMGWAGTHRGCDPFRVAVICGWFVFPGALPPATLPAPLQGASPGCDPGVHYPRPCRAHGLGWHAPGVRPFQGRCDLWLVRFSGGVAPGYITRALAGRMGSAGTHRGCDPFRVAVICGWFVFPGALPPARLPAPLQGASPGCDPGVHYARPCRAYFVGA